MLKGIALMMALDAVGTVALIMVARRNPVIRRRLVDAFCLLVGDAYLSVNRVREAHAEDDGVDYQDDVNDEDHDHEESLH